MDEKTISLIDASKALEPRIFSLPRLILLNALRDLGPDGASFRELVAGLKMPEGVIFANLKAMEQLGYIESESGHLEGTKMTSFHITKRGEEEFDKARNWLRRLGD